jgi:hypothetical protein
MDVVTPELLIKEENIAPSGDWTLIVIGVED